MDAGHLARAEEILQDTVRLYHDMLAIIDLYLCAYDRIDEGQFRQPAVI